MTSGKVMIRCQNVSENPVTAFKGTWAVLDDFNQVAQSGDILFTSQTPVGTPNIMLGGYVIQPHEIIYLVSDETQRVAMVGRFASEMWGNFDGMPPGLKKSFKAAITDVAFAELHDRSDSTENNNSKTETPEAEPTKSDADFQQEQLYFITDAKDGMLNIRSGPGANYPTVNRLPVTFGGIRIIEGPVMNDTTEWVRISFGEKSGWVARRYLAQQPRR